MKEDLAAYLLKHDMFGWCTNPPAAITNSLLPHHPTHLTSGLRYQTCSGICLGIWLVRTGCSMVFFLLPKYAPMKMSGREIPNHITMSAKKVPKGMAEEECCD